MKRNTVSRFGALFLAVLLTGLIAFLLTGCEKLVSVSSIRMKAGQEEISIEVGSFDYADYTVVICYEDGTEIEEPLKEEYISGEDSFKLYCEGTHEITVRAHMRECKFTLNVGRHSFPDSVRLCPPEDAVDRGGYYAVPYTGSAHSVSVGGPVPAGTKITYSYGNSFTEARGEDAPYECRAILTCEGYLTKELSCLIAVTPATYDMSKVTFEDKTVDYDGKNKSVEIGGELPKGVSVSYRIGAEKGNSATMAGEYTVIAEFSGDSRNYLPIPSMSATLRIQKETVDTAAYGTSFANAVGNADAVYDGNEHTPYVITRLPAGVDRAEIRITDAEGNEIAHPVNAGKYGVSLTLYPIDPDNHQLTEGAPTVTYHAVYTVKKQFVDSTKIFFDNSEIYYDGKPHTLVATGEKIENLDVRYSAAGMPDGVLSFVNAGKYEITAVIPENPNYEFEQVEKKATLTILPIPSGFVPGSVSNVQSTLFDGEIHALSFPMIPEQIGYMLTVNRQSPEQIEVRDVGDYVYRFTFIGTENYTDLPEYAEYSFSVLPIPLTLSEKYYRDQISDFTGSPVAYDAKVPEGISVRISYGGTADENTPPVSAGDYPVTLVFSAKNYEPLTKTVYIRIGKRVIFDTVFENEFSAWNGRVIPYGDGYSEVFAEHTYTAACDNPEASFCYNGEALANPGVRVVYRITDTTTGLEISEIVKPGTYRILPIYVLEDSSSDVVAENTCTEITLTVTKKEIQLKNGVDFHLGYYDKNYELTAGDSVSETGRDIRIELISDNPLIGTKITVEGFEKAGGSMSIGMLAVNEVGTYTIKPRFRSDYYIINTETLTFTVTPADINTAFEAKAKIRSYSPPYNFLPNISVLYDGTEVTDLQFDTAALTVSWANMPKSLTVSYEMYQADTKNGKWIVLSNGEKERMTYPQWSGIYYIRFTVSNGNEIKSFYSIPEHENYYSHYTDPDYFCFRIG
ncbi:MAG: MBG domain-containing protein [Clostridia bacterium]|nr:MBG domain-containing protein [Clostridia bacterium]